eukprot:NODE_20_length_44879_cov_0.624654.p33 type:complete len:118 gc:universal NODE_20_length_44879_cov_0.624654:2980-2627(-)
MLSLVSAINIVIMTLSSCVTPLDEVLKLWDYYFAYGVHLNILCVVGQLVRMKEEILHHPSPVKLLRSFPALDAADLIAKSQSFSKLLNTQLELHLQQHVYDLALVHRIIFTNKINNQ